MITLMNWDEIVREEKRKGKVQSITWGTHGYNLFKGFTKAETYFGIKHYHDPKIKGYTVQWKSLI